MKKVHTTRFEVRDYECDMQSIVNNSVYQNYLEHARHCFFKDNNMSFLSLCEAGLQAVVIKAELNYRISLKSGDIFNIETAIRPAGRIRFIFDQQIWLAKREKLIMDAFFTCTVLNHRGRPEYNEQLRALISQDDSLAE